MLLGTHWCKDGCEIYYSGTFPCTSPHGRLVFHEGCGEEAEREEGWWGW